MQKITPFLWFNDNAEEAMNFYVSIFKDARVVSGTRYGKEAPMPEGSLMSATMELAGQRFMVLNGGPMYTFTEAISFFVDCKDQAEVDYYWEKLSAGGTIQQCGWLKDKYGVSWQIIPQALGKYLSDKDPEKAKRAMDAMLRMTKIDVAALEAAHDGA